MMQETDTATHCRQKGKNTTHNVAFLINGTEKYFIDTNDKIIQKEAGSESGMENGDYDTTKDRFLHKSPFLYENYSDVDDQEMSLSSKMDFFYSKSENNFGIESGCLLEDYDQLNSNRSSKSGRMHSSISSSREDVSVSESLINIPQEFDKTKTQVNSKEIETLNTGQFKNKLDTEATINNSSSLTTGLGNNTSRSSSKLSKHVSLEVSLPSSTQELLDNLSSKHKKTSIDADIDDCSTNSQISSVTLNFPSFINSQSNQEPGYSECPENGYYSDNDSEDSSWSSTKNLQEEIDKRILKGQLSGSLDFSNMKLPFLPSAILSADISMINRLNLHDNQLISLPGATIKQLVLLTWLDLRFNSLKDLPKEIGHLKLLQVLLLQGNNIEYLPVQLGHLSELKTLKFTDNPIKYPPRHIINGGLEIIKKFLAAVAKRKRNSFKAGSETSARNYTTKTYQICDSASDISGSKAKDVKTLIEIDSHGSEITSKEASSCYNSVLKNLSINSSCNDDLEEKSSQSMITNTDEVAEDDPAIADDSEFFDSVARTVDDATSTIDSTNTAVGLVNDATDNSDEESCNCSNPTLRYTNANKRHRKNKTKVSPRSSVSSLGVNDGQHLKKDDGDRTSKRLCEKIKEESLKDVRRKSLHLILQNATSDDEVDVTQTGKCFKCRRRIDHKSENSNLVKEVAQVSVTQLIPDLRELEDHSNKPKLMKRKKVSNLKSSKLPKPKLITARKVENRIRHDRLRTMKTKEAETELQEIQHLRSKLGLRSWREVAKQRQVEFAQNYSEYDFIPPFAEAPFAIDEKLLPPRLRPKTPTFSKLNERQRKLSSIESDIKECLRKLGAQEKKFSGESSSEMHPNSFLDNPNVRPKDPKVSLKKCPSGSPSTKETTAVLNQLHSLRRQIQRLKLNSFI